MVVTGEKYDVGNRGDMKFYDGRRGSRSKGTSYYSYLNILQIADGDWRGGYRYQTNHSPSHNPGDHGRLLRVSVDTCHVAAIINDNVEGDIRDDNERSGSMSQYIIHL